MGSEVKGLVVRDKDGNTRFSRQYFVEMMLNPLNKVALPMSPMKKTAMSIKDLEQGIKALPKLKRCDSMKLSSAGHLSKINDAIESCERLLEALTNAQLILLFFDPRFLLHGECIKSYL